MSSQQSTFTLKHFISQYVTKIILCTNLPPLYYPCQESYCTAIMSCIQKFILTSRVLLQKMLHMNSLPQPVDCQWLWMLLLSTPSDNLWWSLEQSQVKFRLLPPALHLVQRPYKRKYSLNSLVSLSTKNIFVEKCLHFAV